MSAFADLIRMGLTATAVATMPSPAPSPSPTPAAPGPCASPALSSLAVRPGLGRTPATGGATCVARPGGVVISLGYREQVTNGPTRQELLVYPAPVFLIGTPYQNELVIAPSLAFSRRIGTGAAGLPPLSGVQDAGIGVQHLLSDRPSTQQAIEAFMTMPTGYPTGATGFSAGSPSFQLAYTIAFSLSSAIGISVSNSLVNSLGWSPDGFAQRFIQYQPSATLSYALTPATTLLLEDQVTAPGSPHGQSGNRALIAIQQTLSPAFVIDLDYEVNALPPPGLSQHTIFEGGLTVRL